MKRIYQESIDLLRRSESLALKYHPDGFYLAFSGGKDSQALYHIAKMAGVKFKAHMALTSVDPPEVIRFVKSHYPDVVLHKPKDSIYNISVKRKFLLPSRIIRWCCAELKEEGGGRNGMSHRRAQGRKHPSLKAFKRRGIKPIFRRKSRPVLSLAERTNRQEGQESQPRPVLRTRRKRSPLHQRKG